ncbi:hypothetical protein F5Y00DRAFT_264889 [Daldinia vernicosa]|uniref:uncharacterized protein n=1 Tax=Daldinia vernicosa TaxID=114800 RepID=UPI002008DA9B|nr:uncharacterized protein F5Y00DRAFT_264889 [Daldinia vernicosa]KAI0846170.1 hypothetical protein F5Y00DRAFT_264889 [Daldinia vernicosa]
MEKGSTESRDRLLGETEYMDANFRSSDESKTSIRRWIRNNAFLLVIFVLLLYIAIVLTIDSAARLGTQEQCLGVDKHFRLPGNAVRYEEKQEWYTLREPWNKEPSDELDDLWEDLLYALNIRVSPHEMEQLGSNLTNRIQVDGGDYLGVMGVYHHLHCLNNLRRIVHWDYYESRVSDLGPTGPFGKGHSDHCINAIRQALMCHANTEIHTGQWIYDPDRPQASKLGSHSITTCVNWDSLNNWARSRALRAGEYTYRPVPIDETMSD